MQVIDSPPAAAARCCSHVQAAQAAIAAGDYWRLREVLQGSQWSEKEGHALMFHAAVEACNHTMLQVGWLHDQGHLQGWRCDGRMAWSLGCRGAAAGLP